MRTKVKAFLFEKLHILKIEENVNSFLQKKPNIKIVGMTMISVSESTFIFLLITYQEKEVSSFNVLAEFDDYWSCSIY